MNAVRLLPPVPVPPKILCVGLNYDDHLEESGLQKPTWQRIAAVALAVSGIANPLKCSGDLEVRFAMPEGVAVEATGRVAWADVRGKAGIRFTHIDPQLVSRLQQWISEKQQEEGWTVAEVH